jgi:hypothetical protein
MDAARGIVTARGGMTSHAAVVARGMGRPCVSGAGEMHIDMRRPRIPGAEARPCASTDTITIDGSTGEVLAGVVKMIEPELSGDFGTLMGWADESRRLKVRANAETALDAQVARQFGAEGIGLCRTEHMFFDPARIAAVREMILADDAPGRKAALSKILPMQRADFVSLFKIMEGLPVTIRLLDPPLHEFLPHSEEDVQAVAEATGLDPAKLLRRASELHEVNPMLGHRGCRLGVSYPEIYEMQVRAIIEAACEAGSTAKPPIVEIMHPLVAKGEEMAFLRQLTDRVAKEVLAEQGREIEYQVGAMVELPPRRHPRRRPGAERRVLLLRHQRPDPDHLRHQPRRLRPFPERLYRQGHLREGPLRQPRPGRRRRPDPHRRRTRPGGSARREARHLRRTRRRPGLDRVLRVGRVGLRELLAVPRPDRPPGRRASRDRRARERPLTSLPAAREGGPLAEERAVGRESLIC